MKSNFSELTDSELLSSIILYESGKSFSDKRYNKITKIVKVTKTGFRINGIESLFNRIDGKQKGLNGRQDMATISNCYIITEKEREDLIAKWTENKLRYSLITSIKEVDLNKLTTGKLQEIKNLIS